MNENSDFPYLTRLLEIILHYRNTQSILLKACEGNFVVER
jgi:hypothetical protein